MFSALVVDDEEDICDFLSENFEELEIEVNSAMTGEKALELVNAKHWDIAIVDLKLSTTITGLDIIKTLHEKSPGTHVFAMTGYVDIGLKQEAERLGVEGYLSKPTEIMSEPFLRKMRAVIDKLERQKSS